MLKRWATWPRGTRWLIGLLAAVVLVLAVVWVLFVPAADWFARHDVGPATGPLHETALDNARGRLLALGAGLFAAGALVFTARNFTVSRRALELTEQGQVTDRYTKAIEQLGSDKLDVRIGGIYALERVARDSARDHPTVMEVLTAFVREHSREAWPLPADDEPGADAPSRATRPDVQAAVTVVGRRDAKHDNPGRPIDLARADLSLADLDGADLSGARLTGADLTFARLSGADLSGAILAHADLTGARLSGADLTFARLSGADLTDARLTGARLTGAYFLATTLIRADLSDAVLTSANLKGVNLNRADLTRANLDGAHLTGAHLSGADLSLAALDGADLSGADLSGADLSRADLTRADLDCADFSEALVRPGGVIPQGWQRDTDSGRLKRADTNSGATTTN